MKIRNKLLMIIIIIGMLVCIFPKNILANSTEAEAIYVELAERMQDSSDGVDLYSDSTSEAAQNKIIAITNDINKLCKDKGVPVSDVIAVADTYQPRMAS